MYIVGWVFPGRMLKASTLILERRSQVGNSWELMGRELGKSRDHGCSVEIVG